MRLTAEVLLRSEGYLNPNKDRELSLRSLKLAVIENLAILQDQFDIIDFSDNEIIKLDNFPRMQRLSTIFMNNNYISRIGAIGEQLSALESVILTNNKIAHFSEIKNLASAKSLQFLSLMDNPIAAKAHYRVYCIHKFPLLKLLDYQKVSLKERQAVVRLFSSDSGIKLLETIEEDRSTMSNSDASKQVILTDGQKQQVREAIEAASTREEIDVIERQLKTGTFPFHEEVVSGKRKAEDVLIDNDDDHLRRQRTLPSEA